MNASFRFHVREKRSSVLVLTLLILVLVSVIVLGLLASVTLEKQLAESAYQQRRAMEMSFMAYQNGVSQLRNALGTNTDSWDNPYANFCTNPPKYFWSVSPGIITRWSYSQTTPLTNIPLFSYVSAANTNLAKLNRPLADGSYPIIGGANPPDVAVQFVNVLQDPTQGSSAANPIIGRYAFWIDDESAKININVADGTQKYTTNSLGLGSPTEVSLQVLSQGGSTLTTTVAGNIVQMARTNSFHSPREILRVPGTTPDLYTNNVFNLTDYSRSPDLNVFGQPKMALLPIIGNPEVYGTNMVINGLTLLPETEIYPTPSQLPPYYVNITFPGYPNPLPNPWPLAFRACMPSTTSGSYDNNLQGDYKFGTVGNHLYKNGAMLAGYLAGTNGGGMPITWPAFSGTSSPGFRGKYSDRQIDEIAIQLISFSSKLTSSDYAYARPGDYPASMNVTDSSIDFENIQQNGYYFNVAPLIWPGWLSKQYVIGLGRSSKVTRFALSLQTFGAQQATSPPSYTPPSLLMTPSVEEWIPTSYRAGTPGTRGYFQFRFGNGNPSLNRADIGQNGNGGHYATTLPAYLPKYPADSAGSTNSYWANQMLTNNQGIDFENNQNPYSDPDQLLAQKYHDPWALPPSGTPPYLGAAASYAHPSLYMNDLQKSSDPEEWGVNTTYAGQLRCVQTYDYFLHQYLGNSYPVPLLNMQTNAGSATSPTLTIGGGLSANNAQYNGWAGDSDPTPLETIRGIGIYGESLFVGSASTDLVGGVNSWLATNGMPGSPSGTILRDRYIASVVPVNVTVDVPALNSGEGSSTNVYFYTTDPFVNKFPGDWKQAGTTNAPFPDPVAPPSNPDGYQYYSDTNFLHNLSVNGGDPDSFWIPQMDVPYSPKSQIASHTLIPRSARMPSIGYLQYVRTGIIPDDEAADYSTQHGTPYRLLSFGPAGDSSQTVRGVNYPDWAMLDLFYMPSILYSFGGPYAGNTNLAPFGTFGGATAGRINPNGCVIYTTNVAVPSAVLRTLPLQATLNGLLVNQTFTGTVDHPGAWGYSNVSGTTILDSVGSSTLAGSIALYIHDNGPLRMPGEICNIPAVAALKAPENTLGTRNDLVRQMVGELTTQSNVFSVWTVGQVIQKIPGNSQFGEFENGDKVLGEVRFHFIVERYLDPGADGVYGNSKNPGYDNVVGSFDDPIDVNHPFEPKYLYRVVRSEELR